MPRPGSVAAVERAARGAAGVVELAHAEEGEVVVAQPFEEGDRFGDGILVERHRRIAEIGDGAVEAGEHRLPVVDCRPHLLEQPGKPQLQPFRPVLRKPGDMRLDDADAVDRRVALARLGKDLDDARFAMPHRHDRVNDEGRLAGALGDFAEHGIEQERHVVVDDGDHRDRAAIAGDARVGADVGDAGPGQVVQNRLVRDGHGAVEVFGL